MENIDLVIWDLDGTKYKFHDDIHDIANQLLVGIVNQELDKRDLENLSEEEILREGKKSYERYGMSWMVFAERFELDYNEMFQLFNITMPLTTVDSTPSVQYKERIQESKSLGIKHIIFTHGSRKWARKVLEKLDLSDEFNDEVIFDASHTEWSLKHHGIDAYKKLKVLHDFSPETSLMVEDTPKCLEGAKEMGLSTVLIDRQNTVKQNKPDHIDFVFQSPEGFLDHIVDCKKQKILQNKM